MTTLSLLREKFTIRDIEKDGEPVIALGNRMVISLPGQSIPLIIRCHSMHMTLRFGAEIIRHLSYISHVENVNTLMNWEEVWQKLIKPYEKDASPQTWIALYFKGNPIFQDNYHHMFFDVIEQCEYKNNMEGDRYEKSIIMAQKAFRQIGRNVLIEEESHVGFILDTSDRHELRFAIILRIPGHRGTFITRLCTKKIIPSDHVCLAIAADYIEAINMAVRAGFLEKSLSSGSKKSNYEQVKAHSETMKRLGALQFRIDQAEQKYALKYRPERPDFKEIMQRCIDA